MVDLIDIWNGYTAADERKEKVAFTIPYMENRNKFGIQKVSKYPPVCDMAETKF